MYPITGKIFHEEQLRLNKRIREVLVEDFGREEYRQNLLEELNQNLEELQFDMKKLI